LRCVSIVLWLTPRRWLVHELLGVEQQRIEQLVVIIVVIIIGPLVGHERRRQRGRLVDRLRIRVRGKEWGQTFVLRRRAKL
jgi:hypothetical protein